jgi:hypothetical protein
MTRPLLDYWVLDTLANDIESLPHIHELLNHPDIGWTDLHGGPIPRDAVEPTLRELIRERLIRAYVCPPGDVHMEEADEGVFPEGDADEVYFGLTPQGRAIHAAWEPTITDPLPDVPQ